MTHKIRSYAYIFWLLIKTDLVILKKLFIGKVINVIAWSGSLVVVATYILPQLGMTERFGEFIVVSSLASACYWGIWDSTYKFVADAYGQKVISYNLILPLPSWLVIVQRAVKHAMYQSLPSLILLPLYKLLLRDRMDLFHFSFFKFVFIFFTISLFTGFLFIFIASFIKNVNKVDTVGIRLLFPMWFFGASNYPWYTIFSLNHYVGYLSLLNPLVYMMEGIHSAVLNPKNFLPFWICAAVLWVLIFIFGYFGIVRLKKSLDFV